MEIPELCEGDFKIDITTLKTGGEASVFKSYYSYYGDVALKRYKEAFRDDEIKLLKENVFHQNIVRILGILTDSSTPPKRIGYIMPYMRMGSLDEIIHNKGKNYDGIYTNEQITLWINKICCGLSYLHSRNIIHRDIKPSNVLVGESYDDVQLSDFGIARSISSITRCGLTTSCGTPFYMAPEVFKGQEYDLPVDIYSLSITIWEMSHRRVPYDHVSVQYNLLDKISKGRRPELINFCSKEVSDLLTRCWDASPSLRPTITDVLEFSRTTTFQLPEKMGTILILGGEDRIQTMNSLLILQKNRKKWKRVGIKLPHGIKDHGAQFLNNNLYIFGGYNGNSKELNCTYKLSTSLQWEEMANMNQKRYFISNSSVILNNQIWACGGGDRKEGFKSVEMYDPEANEWKYVKKMNRYRYKAAAAVVNGKIFCCSEGSVEWYDLSSDFWTLIDNVPPCVMGHGAVEMNGKFIVMGGLDMNSYEILSCVWALDTTDENAVWIKKASMSIPRRYFSIAKIDGKIFVCGGESEPSKSTKSVEIFDEESWRNGPEVLCRRSHAPAIVISMSCGRSLN